MTRRVAALAAVLTLLHGVAAAQDPPPPENAGGGIAGIGEAIYHVFTRPVHPTLESVAPGGGLTGGIAATPEPFRHDSGMLGLEGRASVSLKKYWIAEGRTWWQGGARYRVEGYGRARSMRELDFYGLGSDTPESLRTNFRLDDLSVGTTGWVRPLTWLGVGGRLEGLWPDVGAGHNTDVPSVDALFTEVSAPGLTPQPAFARAAVFVDVNYPSNEFERPRTGGDYQIAYNVFSDRGAAANASFRRVDVEMQQRIGLGARPRLLTLHLLFSAADPVDGHSVPFYLMPTLGGSKNLQAFGEELIGGDENTATLRGFSDFRFRDRNLLLVQAEYRMKVWGPIHATVFVDAGQVAPELSELALSRLKRDVGFSLSLMRSDATAIRIDFAFGGGEGFHHYLAPGRVLAP